MSVIVRKYLTQDLSEDEKRSYIEYIRGNENSTDWVEKALVRREGLLLVEPQCQHRENNTFCSAWVNIRETGECRCSRGHLCYDQVLDALETLT